MSCKVTFHAVVRSALQNSMCVLWYIFAGQVLFRPYALRKIRLRSFAVNRSLRNRTGEERRQQTLSDKRDNNFV